MREPAPPASVGKRSAGRSLPTERAATPDRGSGTQDRAASEGESERLEARSEREPAQQSAQARPVLRSTRIAADIAVTKPRWDNPKLGAIGTPD